MADTTHNYATPSAARSVTSYPARRGFKQGPIDPSLDRVVGVEDAIDIHCHAHEGQQDALGVAKLASKSGMMGLLYKTIGGERIRRRRLTPCAARWILVRGDRYIPAHVWAGSSVTQVFSQRSRQRGRPRC